MSMTIKRTADNAEEKKGIDWDAGRRAFIRSAGIAAAGVALLAKPMPAGAVATPAALTDADILNFALNLEYLEAEFYLRAAFGRGLATGDTTGVGHLGVVVGGRQVAFANPNIKAYAEEIAGDEEAHVKFLRSALGGAKVARPRIDLNMSFTTAARAAGLVGPTEKFDAFRNDVSFLLAAFIFEDVGVTAYKGAARYIANPDFLEAAAGILAVEAYHAGTIRTVLYGYGNLFDEVRKISDLRDAADGPGDRDQPIRKFDPMANPKANIVPSDVNGLAYSRTTDQVLNIAYLGGQAANFGFFPNKLNGTIK